MMFEMEMAMIKMLIRNFPKKPRETLKIGWKFAKWEYHGFKYKVRL